MKAKRLVLALVALAVLGGCAEATATNEAPSAWATKEADPAFVRRAEVALAAAPAPQPGWRVGVILADKDDKDTVWVASDGRTVHHVCAEDMRVIRKAAA